MNKPLISLIAAIGKGRELGKGNDLIFKIPEDMKFFKDKTYGHPIIMGRKTFESIGHPLPYRLNIVVSRSMGETIADNSQLVVVPSLEEAMERAKKEANGEIFIIGGAKIFEQAIKFADKLYLTLVDAEAPDADVFFPEYHEFKNKISERKSHDGNYSYTFLELEK